jgi:hypothetical protein
MNWLLSPLAQYGALGATLIVLMALFASLKLEICGVGRASDKSDADLCARLAAAETALEQLRQTGIANSAEGVPANLAGRPPESQPGLNLTRRAQALRMRQRGEPIPTIAAALRVPQNEIELLIKLQDAKI